MDVFEPKIVISRDSPLRRMPANLNPRQMLFLDGIRHAAEMASLAHQRLRATLTSIAKTEGYTEESLTPQFTAAFLDVWSIVDALDRLRALLRTMPGMIDKTPADGRPGFRARTEELRNARNIADHLAQRVDYVISRNATALGSLTWYTVLDEADNRGAICTIVPGTARKQTAPIVNPGGQSLKPPTGMIKLAAGGYEVDIDDVMEALAEVIGEIELQLAAALASQEELDPTPGSDYLIRLEVKGTTPTPRMVDAEQLRNP